MLLAGSRPGSDHRQAYEPRRRHRDECHKVVAQRATTSSIDHQVGRRATAHAECVVCPQAWWVARLLDSAAPAVHRLAPVVRLAGAALAPAPDPRVVLGALLAFGLAVGIGAHAFDELRGRPLGTRTPTPVLKALGATGLALAAALGITASTVVGPGFLALVLLGVLLVAAYGFEMAPFHSDLGFALAWGAFPVVATAYAVGAPSLSTGLAALGAALLSLAQRRLSTPVRALRRRAVAVTGQVSYRDGSTQPIDAPGLIAVPEGALRLLWPAAVLMSAGVLGARWL